MAKNKTWRARRISFMHQVHARRAARTDVETAFQIQPEPRTIGLVTRGQQLVAGEFLFSGLRINRPNHPIWDIARDHDAVADEIHECRWLDDLAAVGDEFARELAQSWVFGWIDRFGNGRGGGWTPGVAGRRLIRWINHSAFLLRGQDKAAAARFFESLGQQTLFVSRRWKTTEPGIRRFEALTGTLYASLSLKGLAHHADQAFAALSAECQSRIDLDGAIETRNPEELLEVLSLLNWSAMSAAQAGRDLPMPVADAIGRIVPTLRALRHADGGLARFHGGGGGVPGRLDEALAISGIRALPTADLHMGYARLHGGRTTLIADGTQPPQGQASKDAHAGTLAFELTSGRRPLIVNCGSGARFGDEWRRASRSTPSHSTLGIDGFSSSKMTAPTRFTGTAELLSDGPEAVIGNISPTETGTTLELSQNGYRPSHGLTHARTLQLSIDGRKLAGEDILITLNQEDEAVFTQTQMRSGIHYSIRFHLHPTVTAQINTEQTVVALTLKSGEVWRFDHDGAAKLSLVPSVYFKNGHLNPIASQQVVLSGTAMSYATRVRWSLAKTQDTPDVVRDLVQADL